MLDVPVKLDAETNDLYLLCSRRKGQRNSTMNWIWAAIGLNINHASRSAVVVRCQGLVLSEEPAKRTSQGIRKEEGFAGTRATTFVMVGRSDTIVKAKWSTWRCPQVIQMAGSKRRGLTKTLYQESRERVTIYCATRPFWQVWMHQQQAISSFRLLSNRFDWTSF